MSHFLFDESRPYKEFRSALEEPLNADTQQGDDHFAHEQKCFIIRNDAIKPVTGRTILIRDVIECLYFVYVDLGRQQWDDKYWFFVGKLVNTKGHDIFFAYEAGCNGTGFGLGEQSCLHLSDSLQRLCQYGLTDKQRELIMTSLDLGRRYHV